MASFINAFSTASGAAVTTAIGIPVVGSVTGWAVQQSINSFLNRLQAAVAWKAELAAVAAQLNDDWLRFVIDRLDNVTDVPGGPLRSRYLDVCAVLIEANFVLADSEVKRSAGGGDAIVAGLTNQMQTLKNALKSLCSDIEVRISHLCDMRDTRIGDARQYCAAALSLGDRVDAGIQPLHSFAGCRDDVMRGVRPMTREPPDIRLVQHGADLVPRICGLVQSTRNVGIVGMGGIGKTAVAAAVFRRAKTSGEYAHTVWLNVGRNPNMTGLLQAAFFTMHSASLKSCPFSDAGEGLRYLASHFVKSNEKVLLVLDDVWCSSLEPVVAALNFATNPGVNVDGSRLVVTTRQRSALSYAPFVSPAMPMLELAVIEVPPLDSHPAHQLFRQHAFPKERDDWRHEMYRPSETRCSEVISACGRNPLAIVSLAELLRHRPADKWCGLCDKFDKDMQAGADKATRTCAMSIQDLPPSVMECFVAFAAFPVDSQVPKAHLMHFVAMNSPLPTVENVAIASCKLDDLVQRSLVSVSAQEHGEQVYCMPRLLYGAAWRIASGAGQPLLDQKQILQTSARFHFRPTDASAHCFSVHKCPDWAYPTLLQEYTGARDRNKLQACIVSDVCRPPSPHLWPRWLRCLHLRSTRESIPQAQQWIGHPHQPSDSHLSGPPQGLPVLQSLNLARTDPNVLALQRILPSKQLLHLDLSGCSTIRQLPDCVQQCDQLIRLKLSGCSMLGTLQDEAAFNIASFPGLQDLDLSGCQNLQRFPAHEPWPGCTALTGLNLGGCSSLIELPESFLLCSTLRTVCLRGCSRLQVMPVFGAHGALQHIDLGECVRLTHLGNSIENCTVLQRLDLSGCSGLQELPQEIEKCMELSFLDLSGYKGSVLLPPMSLCSDLQHVCLRGSPELAEVPSCISACWGITRLDLSHCQKLTGLPQHDPDNDVHVVHELRSLDLADCINFESFPGSSQGYRHLTQLNVEGCSHAGFSLPAWIGECSDLAHLSLTGCSHLPGLPYTILDCTQLSYLNLSQCSSDLTEHEFGDLMHGAVQLTGLAHLDLSACLNLTSLPSLSQLAKLTRLQLSGCSNLTGLPNTIGACSQLACLCLQGCSSLTQLPDEICSSPQCHVHLAHLDLRGCSQLRELPRDLYKLRQLQYFATSDSGVTEWLMSLHENEDRPSFEWLIRLAVHYLYQPPPEQQ